MSDEREKRGTDSLERLVRPLTGETANALVESWKWADEYWTTRHADAKAIYSAARKQWGRDKSWKISCHETKDPYTGQNGWLLIRVA